MFVGGALCKSQLTRQFCNTPFAVHALKTVDELNDIRTRRSVLNFLDIHPMCFLFAQL